MTALGSGIRRNGGWLALIGASAVIGTAGTLAMPVALGRTVDALVGGGDSRRWLALVVLLVVIGITCEVVDALAGTACVAGTTARLRDRLVRHVLAAGPHRTRRFDPGDLVSRVSGNAADAAQVTVSMVSIAVATLPPVGSLVLLLLIDPVVAAAFVAGLALVGLVLRAFTRRTVAVVGDYQRAQGRIAARLAESLVGARTIAAAGTLDQERRRVLRPLPELAGHGQRTWRALARTSGEAAVVGPVVLIAVLAVGGLALVHGRISTGELLAASRYAVIGAGLGSLTGVLGRLARARAAGRRTGEVLGTPRVDYGTAGLPVGPGRLEFDEVTVYSGQSPLLDRVRLDVPGGATVAVVGRSGSGKSLLAALAARLRDPDEGEVRLDGVPLPALSHRAIRAAVGCAFERPVLVGGTVADAVGLGLDADRVRAAAQATGADDFIRRLPRGYDTPLTEAPMSGGEAQRLGLARAWPASRVLVLDDATSSLDVVSELRISRTLAAEHGRRTHLVVTHRAGTAAQADQVVWLESGRVRAVGPHRLLWTDPDYRAVFR